jgi:putative toxin-antitoxin system antitoxin component (TIGR02293 family)
MGTQILSGRTGRTSPAGKAKLSITARAGEVFANRRKALRWLQSPSAALGGISPLAAAETPEGRREVEDILGRIEHGVIG